jgi:pyruvate dehydrogenase E1 component alpha subunit
MSDPAKYRTKEEVETYKMQDPLEQVKATLLKKKYATEADFEKFEEKIAEIVTDAVEFAESSPYPEAADLYKDIYFEPNYPFIKE